MEATGHCFANNMVRVFAQAGHGGQKFSLEVLDTHKRGHCLRMKAPVLTTREMSTDSHTTREQFTSLSEKHNLILLWPTHNRNERERETTTYNTEHINQSHLAVIVPDSLFSCGSPVTTGLWQNSLTEALRNEKHL